MIKLSCLSLSAALLASIAVITADALSAELEGALQYPPRSVGEDAQPPPPARMLPRPGSPGRIQVDPGGSTLPLSAQRFFIRPPLRWDIPGASPGAGNSG